MECLLPTHLPRTDFFNPAVISVQKINFAMKWEEKDNEYELNFNKVFGRLSLSWILKEEDET